jgi:hypothetical protein
MTSLLATSSEKARVPLCFPARDIFTALKRDGERLSSMILTVARLFGSTLSLLQNEK